ALIAPGGKLLKICREEFGYIRIEPKNKASSFAPSVDYLFESAADMYSEKVLAIVLTGMGSDGHGGAKKLRQKNSVVWAQDEQSSVIYGMPGVIAKANLAHRIINVEEMVSGLKRING
ncbi:MAG: chemotaxis protein CheB, partial [Proteobacteria bacterium]|nr:chemotaxis protein CheB [Pseudomonadota bacterium]